MNLPLRITGFSVLLVLSGCIGAPVEERPTVEPGSPVEERSAVGAVQKEPVPVKPSPAPAEPAAVTPAAAPVPAAEPAAKPPAEQAPKKEAVAVAAAKPAPLDLNSLEKRLKDTEAIGFMTKLTLKNQVSDLLGQFEAHHGGTIKTSLSQLRQPYDLLIMKVLSLLQDRDPPLAHDILASREAIWGILSDPVKFQSLVNRS